MNTLFHGSAKPRGSHTGNVGNPFDEEVHAVRFEVRARPGNVVTQQCDVRVAEPGDVGRERCRRGDRRVLDDFDDAIGTVVDADDRGLHHDGCRHQLPHVARDRVAVHPVRRRQHDETEHVAVPRNRRVDVVDMQRGVGEPRDHENDFNIPPTQCALSVLFQPASMPSLRSSHP
jgi:hypothetical protein